MKYRNLDFIFEAYEIPETIYDCLVGPDFYPPEDAPEWIEDIDEIHVWDDKLFIDNFEVLPGMILVWNSQLKTLQEIKETKDDFDNSYFSPRTNDREE